MVVADVSLWFSATSLAIAFLALGFSAFHFWWDRRSDVRVTVSECYWPIMESDRGGGQRAIEGHQWGVEMVVVNRGQAIEHIKYVGVRPSTFETGDYWSVGEGLQEQLSPRGGSIKREWSSASFGFDPRSGVVGQATLTNGRQIEADPVFPPEESPIPGTALHLGES